MARSKEEPAGEEPGAFGPTRALFKRLRRLVRNPEPLLLSLGTSAMFIGAVAAIAAFLLLGWIYAYLFQISGSFILACLMIIATTALLVYFRAREGQTGRLGSKTGGSVLVFLFTVLTAIAGIAAFAGLTAVLLAKGHASAMPPIKNRDYATAAYEHYLWHAAKTIPFLEIPETTGWEHPKFAISGGGTGVLTLLAKALVILPLIDLVRVAVRRWTRPSARDVNA